MAPELLAERLDVKSPTKTVSRWPASVVVPLLLSAAAAGCWTQLAYFRVPGKAVASLIALLGTACFALFFAAAAWAGGRRNDALRLQLSRCSVSAAVLACFLPEYLARVPPPLLRSNLLMILFFGLWAGTSAVCLRASRGTLSARKAASFALPVLVASFLLVSAIAIRKFLVFGYVGQDVAYFGQILYTTLHGHLFWGNLLQDLLYSKPVVTDFAGHNSPVMFLFLPFYALLPSPATLIVLRNFVLFACAAPVYLLARRSVRPATAWIWVAVFLLTPTILYQNDFDFYPLTFVALPLLYTIHFYLERRFTAFCIALAATLLVREDLALFAIGLGLLSLLHRRGKRWWMATLGVGTFWGVLSFLVILPTALHGASFVTDACFSHLGAGRTQIISNVLLHPRSTIFVHSSFVYLKTLLTSSAFILSLGSPFSLLATPYLAINLLAGNGRCITTVIYAQYSVIPATLLFASAMLTVTRPGRSRLLSMLAHWGLHHEAVPPMFFVALCLAGVVFVTGEQQVDELREHAWGQEADLVMRYVPANSSVAAPRYMLPKLANRDCLYQAHRMYQYHTGSAQYVVLDSDWTHINASEDYRSQYLRLARETAADPKFQLLYASPQYRVYFDPTAHQKGCWPAAPSTTQGTATP